MYPTFTSAALAGATSCLTLHPLEVLRSRVTCDSQGQYRGLVSSTRQIVRSEGVGALYRGLGPALLAIIPEAAITYGGPTLSLDPHSDYLYASLVHTASRTAGVSSQAFLAIAESAGSRAIDCSGPTAPLLRAFICV